MRIGKDGLEVTVQAPCITPGCTSTILYRPSAPPPACAPFGINPPAARLCSRCTP